MAADRTTGEVDTAPARLRPEAPRADPRGVVPTQRGAVSTGPATGFLPTQRPAPGVELLAPERPGDGSTEPPVLAPAPRPASAAPSARRSRVAVAVVVGVVVLLLAALVVGIVLKVQADNRAAAFARAEARVAVDVAAAEADTAFNVQATRTADTAAVVALRTQAVAEVDTAVVAARAALDAAPQAGDAARAGLQAAIDAAQAAADGTGVSVAAMHEVEASLAAQQTAAAQAQAAWQAAEDARIAAEKAAAEKAAAERAAAAAKRPATTRSTPVSSGGGAPAAPASSAWAAGVAQYDVGGLGAAINAHRAANGLNTLNVQVSTGLMNHAAEMAAAWSIWHGGSDHIVGWVQPASADEMIKAYINSPSHNAWLLKEGKTTVSIGAVTLNGRLFTAMYFS